jgi:hypothetical protein
MKHSHAQVRTRHGRKMETLPRNYLAHQWLANLVRDVSGDLVSPFNAQF